MAGQIRRLLDEIIQERSRGDKLIANTTKAKLILKGMDPNKFGPNSEDDPYIIAKVRQIAQELGVTI